MKYTTLAAEDNDCKSGILLKWNHPVFHKFIAQSRVSRPASFCYNGLLVSGNSGLNRTVLHYHDIPPQCS